MSAPNIADLFDKVKKYYCGANPHRNKPENLIKDEKLISSKAGDLIDLEHDLFYEDAWLYENPADKEGSRLIMGIDYELEDEDSIATDQSGYRVYKRVRILKSKDAIFADYEVYGDFSDVNLFNLQARRTRESMEEIADLYKRASASEARLDGHDSRITTAENSIKTNLGKINHNLSKIEKSSSDIENINRDIMYLRNGANFINEHLFPLKDGQEVDALDEIRGMIQEEKQARESYIARTDARLETVDAGIKENKDSIKAIESQLSAIMPIGFCYIQPKDTDPPTRLWPDFQWKQIGQVTEPTTWKRTS